MPRARITGVTAVTRLVRVDLERAACRVREVLRGLPEVVAGYLFGSALGPCRPDSDVDLAVVLAPGTPEPAGWGVAALEARIEALLGEVDGHPFHVTVLSPDRVLFALPVLRDGLPVYVADRDAWTDFIERVARAYPDLHRRYQQALSEVLEDP